MAEDNYDFLKAYEEKPFAERLVERVKNQPFLVVGWTGTLAALIYGTYRFKTRGPSIKPSVFFVQLRVFAQGAIVSSLLLGMTYNMYLEYVEKKKKAQKD